MLRRFRWTRVVFAMGLISSAFGPGALHLTPQAVLAATSPWYGWLSIESTAEGVMEAEQTTLSETSIVDATYLGPDGDTTVDSTLYSLKIIEDPACEERDWVETLEGETTGLVIDALHGADPVIGTSDNGNGTTTYTFQAPIFSYFGEHTVSSCLQQPPITGVATIIPHGAGVQWTATYSSSATTLSGETTQRLVDEAGVVTINLIRWFFTRDPQGSIEIIKTVDGGPIPLGLSFRFELRTGASSASAGTVLGTAGLDATNGIVAFVGLEPDTYQVCENIAPGWGGTIASHPQRFLPASAGVPPEEVDNGLVCAPVEVTLGADISLAIDNSAPPGGMAKTIGFWKNHADCRASKGSQANLLGATLAQAPVASGQVTRGFYVGILYVDTCTEAVALLKKTTLTGKRSASDPAYNFGSQYVAYNLNYLSGSYLSPAGQGAAADGQALLAKHGFNGLGSYTKPLGKTDGGRLNRDAGVLDVYNNNGL